MLRNYVVEVKVIDVNHNVFGAWGQDEYVPMQFLGGDIGCWGGYWSVKDESLSSHSKSHYVCLFLLETNVQTMRQYVILKYRGTS